MSTSKISCRAAPDYRQLRYPAVILPVSSGEVARSAAAEEVLTGPMQGGLPLLLLKAGKWLVKHPGVALFGAKALADRRRNAATADQGAQPEEAASQPSEVSSVGGSALRALLGDEMVSDLEAGIKAPRSHGDVYAINPAMLAAAAVLGDKVTRRADIQTLTNFFAGDPVSALTRPCPLYSLTGFGGQDSYAEALLAGGILDKLKKAVSKVAPTVSKIAGKVASVASLVPGIGSTISAVASKVKGLTDKAASATKKFLGGKSGQGDDTGATGAIQADGSSRASASLTGHALSQSYSREGELDSLLNEAVPPAIYGDPVDFTGEDRDAVREVLATVTVPGVVVAEQYSVAPEDYALSGAPTQEDLLRAGVDGEEEASRGSADTNATPPALAAAPAPDTTRKPALQSPIQTSAGGEVSVTPEASAVARTVTKDVENATPLYQRAFDGLRDFERAANEGAFTRMVADIPADMMKARPNVKFQSSSYNLTPEEVNAVAKWASSRWSEDPKAAVTPALESAMGSLALVTMLRDAQTPVSKDKAEGLVRLAVSVASLPADDKRQADDLITGQKGATISPESSAVLTSYVNRGLLLSEALVDAFTKDARRGLKGWTDLFSLTKGAKWLTRALGKGSGADYSSGIRARAKLQPAVRLLLSEVATLLRGTISDQQLKSNGGLLRDMIKAYAKSEPLRARLTIPAEDISNETQTEAVDSVTVEDEQAWSENRNWLRSVGNLLDDQKLNTVLTALGFGAAVIPLLMTALRKQRTGSDGASSDQEGPIELTTLAKAKARGWKVVGVS